MYWTRSKSSVTTKTSTSTKNNAIMEQINANLLISLTALMGLFLLIWGIYRVEDYYIESSVSGVGLIIAGAILLAGSQLSYYLKQLKTS